MSSKKNTDLVLTYENIDITNKDLDCLNPSTFVNDNIINFYLKYMYRCMLNNDQRQKVHIFDSFFCAALDEIDQGRVVRWLRRVDIFEKDYLVIPAIIDEHWFLIIIQNPGAILTSYNTTGANSTSNGNNNGVNGTSSHRNRRKQPAIIIMDSMPDHTKDKKPQMIQYLYNFIRIACSIKGKTIFVHQLRQFMPSREYGVQLQVNIHHNLCSSNAMKIKNIQNCRCIQ